MCITFAGSDIKLLGNQLQVVPIKKNKNIMVARGVGGGRGSSLSLSLSLFMFVVHQIEATVFK